MHKGEIRPGNHYAIREKPGGPVQRVKILEHIRANHWRAEWIEPNPGLVHFVKSSDIVATWKGLKAFLREEAAKAVLRKRNEAIGFKEGSPLDKAISCVFEATGDEASYFRGTLSGRLEALDRLRARAGVPLGRASGDAYVDRAGTHHLPFDDALELARKFAAAEPMAVLVDVEATERKWAREAADAGGEYMVSLLNEYRAAWALIRQWTGSDPAIAQREAEIQKLERLVWDAIYALQKAGLESEARRLRRAIGRE